MNEVIASAGQSAGAEFSGGPTVRQFRQIVIWPLQIVLDGADARTRRDTCATLIERLAPGIWTLVEDEFGTTDTEFQERHYREFVSFLPHVQRFIYGDGKGPARDLPGHQAPLRVYRRHDVSKVRMWLTANSAPLTFDVAHIDLYFYHEIDAMILAFEMHGGDLPLLAAQEVAYRFGRAYPPGWSAAREAVHCAHKVEWLDAAGAVLSTSDYEERDRFLSFVGRNRTARMAEHWAWLLRPFAPDGEEPRGPLHFRQIEYYRMPIMTYLTVDRLADLSRGDHVRLALACEPGVGGGLPYAGQFLDDFDTRFAYDRYFFNRSDADAERVDTRFFTCGHAFTVVAAGKSPFLDDPERGLLGQFRHQLFLLFMIAHFHKAALLMLADRLVAATKLLDPNRPNSVEAFRQETYRLQASFLRFTQRYYVHKVSDQAHARDLFRMHREHLRIEALYDEVRGEIFDTVQYLDSTMLRRQSGSMHRLTAVTILGLIGTTATGFLGMNLLAEAENPLEVKIVYFGVVTLVCSVLTLITVAASQRLTRWFDWLTGEWDR